MINNNNEEIEFEIKCKMKRSWMNTFCSFLKTMEKFGKNGCSRDMIFYCDGDGDFRPKFELPEYQVKQGLEYRIHINGKNENAYFYDVENRYVTDKDKELLPVTDNIFAQQFFENDDEYSKRITNLFYELDICKSEKEFNEVKNKHLQKLHKIIENKLM